MRGTHATCSAFQSWIITNHEWNITCSHIKSSPHTKDACARAFWPVCSPHFLSQLRLLWAWRRSNNNDVVGWAALPPDELVAEYRESPRYWVFVRSRDFVAPRIASVIVAEREYPVFFRETVVVNRTVVVRDRGPRFAVNPG